MRLNLLRLDILNILRNLVIWNNILEGLMQLNFNYNSNMAAISSHKNNTISNESSLKHHINFHIMSI